MDLDTISAAFSSARAALALVKSAKEVAEQPDHSALLARLNDALTALNDLIGKHGELSIEFAKAQRELEELKSKLRETASVEHHHGAYFSRRNDGTLDGPFSSLQWDSERKLIRLTFTCVERLFDGGEPLYVFRCPVKDSVHRIPRQFVVERAVLRPEEIAQADATVPRHPTLPQPVIRRRSRIDGLL